MIGAGPVGLAAAHLLERRVGRRTSHAARGLRLLRPCVTAARTASADVSVTARQDPAANRAVGAILGDSWTKIKYTNAIYDPETRAWTSDADITEIPFTAFTSQPTRDRVQ